MTKIIKLTESLGGYAKTRVKLVNVAGIQTIEQSEKSIDTHIRMLDKSFFFVKETVDEVWFMVRNDPPAPMIMTAELAEQMGLMK